MKPVGKQTLLVILVLVLVVLNLGLVGFMWYSQRPDNGPGGPSTAHFLIKKLHFDNAQEQQYLELQHQLGDSLKTVKQNERRLHDRFFEMMHDPTPDSAQVAAIIDSMGRNRGQIEYLTFVHFRQVRALCNKEQQAEFDKIIAETMRRMGPPPQGRPHGDDGPPPDRPEEGGGGPNPPPGPRH